ncbi:UNVERIFIED_CONTAM: hypothetical protein Sangu_2325200 [Sesamum angustifolium]|uniref:Uncharacterized protein n=1 Tax=Sesamum angustifolium TaxID=2727405 RepID=A0AAW2L7H0_9LAMI
MPSVQSSPFHSMENPALLSLLHHTTRHTSAKKPSKTSTGSGGGGGLFRMFKLLPMLTTGCKMVALLGARHRKPFSPTRPPLERSSDTGKDASAWPYKRTPIDCRCS